jgi:anti-sigma-K factor RskA
MNRRAAARPIAGASDSRQASEGSQEWRWPMIARLAALVVIAATVAVILEIDGKLVAKGP